MGFLHKVSGEFQTLKGCLGPACSLYILGIDTLRGQKFVISNHFLVFVGL